MAFTLVTVTHDYDLPSQVGALGVVEFTPVEPMRNGAKTVSGTQRVLLAGDGTISVQLDATTDLGTLPTGVRYRVVERLASSPAHTYYVDVPHDQGATLDLNVLTGFSVSSAVTTASIGAQPADADLTALAGLGDGFPERVSGMWSARTATQFRGDVGAAPLLARSTVQTAACTASAGQILVADTTSGTFSVTFPAAPTVGAPVQIGVHWKAGSVPPTIVTTSGDFFGDGTGTSPTDVMLAGETRVWQSDQGGVRWRTDRDAKTLASLDTRYSDAAKAPSTVVYVVSSGSDTNDGLSWKTAKATLSAAISALPTGGGVVEVAGAQTVSTALPQPPNNTIIRGRGPSAQVTWSGTGAMLTLTNAKQVHFESLRLSISSTAGTLFTLSNSFRCSWFRCLLDGSYVGGAATYYGQIGIQFRGNSGDNRIVNCDLNNLGEAIQADTIMNYLVGSVVGSCYTGVHVDAGSSTGGMAVDDCTFVGTAIGGSNVRAHVLIDVPANQTWITNSWFEGCAVAIQAGKNTATVGGPVGMVLANLRLAATTKCLDIQAGRQFRLDNIRFATDASATPTELTVDATNAVDGFACGLISTAGFDIARTVFPSTWSYLPRYTADAQFAGPTAHVGVNTTSGNPSYVQTGNGRARVGYDGTKTVLTDAGGNRDVALISGTTPRQILTAGADGCAYLGNKTQGTANAGGAVVALAMQNAVTLPTSNPSGGGVLYVDNGSLKWRGSSGTTTIVAPA